MLNRADKIQKLNESLLKETGRYSDTFKEDMLIFFSECEENSDTYDFLDKLNNENEIATWIENVVSHIILKFDEECGDISDFINEFTIMNYQLHGINKVRYNPE
ncbi:MAG: hypothetical protein KBD24_03880 [Candidatus Pacebacteria bacterium]|nr:hypothetical protein [Candidatus Paceibacterota bacterium]